MDERTSLDRPDDPLPLAGADAPTEVVRIVGAGEAGERSGAGSRRAEGMPRYGDRPESPPTGRARPALRFPLAGGDVPRPRLRDDDTRIVGPDEGSGPDELFTFGDDDGIERDVAGGAPAEPEGGDVHAVDDGEPVEDVRPAARRQRPRRPASPGGGARSSRAAQPGTDRNLPLAIGVGVVLAVAAVVAMTLGPAWGVAFTTAIVTLCAAELFGALRKGGHQPATLLGLVATASLVTAAYWRGEPALPLVLTLTVVFTLLWYLVGVSRSSPTVNTAVTILTVAYVGVFGSFAALMLRLPNGTGILLGTVLAVVANDVGALFAGRRFGRRAMAAAISPNKTIEGALGGAVASIVVSYVVLDLIGLHPWEAKAGAALALGLLVAVLAPIGDLVESMVKRDLDVKDMGSILPGHGGLIDRFDALLLVLPAAYYLCRLLEIA